MWQTFGLAQGCIKAKSGDPFEKERERKRERKHVFPLGAGRERLSYSRGMK